MNIKSKIKKTFLQLPNDTARDEELRPQELGALVWILSHSDDWQLNRKYMASQIACGTEAVNTAINGLIDKGYIKVKLTRNNKMQFASNDYTVFDTKDPLQQAINLKAAGKATQESDEFIDFYKNYPVSGNKSDRNHYQKILEIWQKNNLDLQYTKIAGFLSSKSRNLVKRLPMKDFLEKQMWLINTTVSANNKI